MTQPDFEEEQLNRLLAMIDSGSQPQSESDELPAIAQPDFQPQDELHHIFIGYQTVIAGGTQKVTLHRKSQDMK